MKEVAALGGFQYFCPGFVVSHGQPVILDVNVPVEIHGLPIAPATCCTATSTACSWCPSAIAADVAAACDAVRAEERALLDLITAPGLLGGEAASVEADALSGAVRPLWRAS